MKKLLLAPLIALGFAAQPASALTWSEFWEPFVDDHHHHNTTIIHHRPHRPHYVRPHGHHHGPLHKHAEVDGFTRGWHSPNRRHYDSNHFPSYCMKLTRYKRYVPGNYHRSGFWKYWTQEEQHAC